MKIVYVDETGTDGRSPLVVMAGVIADSARIGRTRDEFATQFSSFSEVARKALAELKGSDLHRGNGAWRGVDPAERKRVVTQLCEWLVVRKHQLTLAAINNDAWNQHAPADLQDRWLACALHTALQVQRAHQSLEKQKSLTFLVFDEHKAKVDGAAELLYDPPDWTDSYYGRKKREPALACVLDSAFYAKSHHVGLVQVADLFAYLFRRYSELHDHAYEEGYEGETAEIDGWVGLIAPRLLARANRWPAHPKGEAATLYVTVAPESLKSLG